jgi:hypothetical protein
LVCNHYLYGENQKGFTYYRCQSLSCKGTSLREEAFIAAMADPLQYLSLTPALPKILADLYSFAGDTRASQQAETVQTLRLRVGQVDMREERLTDVFINGGLDNDSYQRRRTALQNERLSLKGEIESAQNTGLGDRREAQFLELVKALQNMPLSENSHDLRDFVKMAVSNLSVQQKTIDIKWSNALAMLIDLSGVSCGAPELTNSRKRSHNVTTPESSRKGGKVSHGAPELTNSRKRSHNVTTPESSIEKLLRANSVRLVEAIRNDDALDREQSSSQNTPTPPHAASKSLGNLRC